MSQLWESRCGNVVPTVNRKLIQVFQRFTADVWREEFRLFSSSRATAALLISGSDATVGSGSAAQLMPCGCFGAAGAFNRVSCWLISGGCRQSCPCFIHGFRFRLCVLLNLVGSSQMAWERLPAAPPRNSPPRLRQGYII